MTTTTETSTIYLETRYHGATDTRGARVSVGIIGNDAKRRVQYAYDYSAQNPHLAAVVEFLSGYTVQTVETVAQNKRGNMYRVEYSDAHAHNSAAEIFACSHCANILDAEQKGAAQ